MNNILLTAPVGTLPKENSNTYLLLKILSDKNNHARDHLCYELGGGFRAYLQKLMGEYYQHWLIHSEQMEYNGKKQSFYWLDKRHFSCDKEKDQDARTIAQKQYKDRAYYGSENAVKRLEKARKEKEKADKEYKYRIKNKRNTHFNLLNDL